MTKHNLIEAHKHFMRLSEGYLATSLEEDDEEEAVPSDNGNEDDNQAKQNPNQPNDDADFDGMDGGVDMNGDMNKGNDMGNDGFGMDNMGQGMDDFGDEANDDTVIDVEDITNAQEKLNKKQNSLGRDLGDVDERITSLLTAVKGIQDSILKNNNDISDLKAELEKRVPTDTEKLSMQSLKMYPYNVSPKDYWENVEKGGRYEAEDDDKKKVYKIREKDINDYSDSSIEKSFDDELHQTMNDIFSDF